MLFPLIHTAYELDPWLACLGMFEAPDTQQYHYRKETKPQRLQAGRRFQVNGEFAWRWAFPGSAPQWLRLTGNAEFGSFPQNTDEGVGIGLGKETADFHRV